MQELQRRIQSTIPTPPARYGYSIAPVELIPIAYDGTTLTYFLNQKGADWRQYRAFLKENQIGRVTELEEGRQVIVRKK